MRRHQLVQTPVLHDSVVLSYCSLRNNFMFSYHSPLDTEDTLLSGHLVQLLPIVTSTQGAHLLSVGVTQLH